MIIDRILTLLLCCVAVLLLGTVPGAAAETAKLDAANTAWILTASALVLFMTLPGLAMFYGG